MNGGLYSPQRFLPGEVAGVPEPGIYSPWSRRRPLGRRGLFSPYETLWPEVAGAAGYEEPRREPISVYAPTVRPPLYQPPRLRPGETADIPDELRRRIFAPISDYELAAERGTESIDVYAPPRGNVAAPSVGIAGEISQALAPYHISKKRMALAALADFFRQSALGREITGEAGRQRRLAELYRLYQHERQRELDELQRRNIESGISYREAQAERRDTKVDEYTSEQGERVIVFQKPTGETYERVFGKVQPPQRPLAALSDIEEAFQREYNRLPTRTELLEYERQLARARAAGRPEPSAERRGREDQAVEATAGDYLVEAKGDPDRALQNLEGDLRSPNANADMRRLAARIRQRIRERVRPGATRRDRLSEILEGREQ